MTTAIDTSRAEYHRYVFGLERPAGCISSKVWDQIKRCPEPQAAEYSPPMVQHVNLIANRDRGGCQLADRDCDPSIGQVAPRVVVKADDQGSGVMASGSDDQVMKVFEVLRVASQNWERLGTRPLLTLDD